MKGKEPGIQLRRTNQRLQKTLMNSKVLSRIDRESTAILTFERSSKLNALNYELVDAIVHALDEIEEEEHIRAVVLTGSGRAFSAGADIHAKSEIALGMPPCFGGTQRLPRLIGRKRALQMLLTSDPISAAQAKEVGLVNALAPKEALLDDSIVLARRIARFAPEVVEVCLHAVHRGLNSTIDEGLAIEAQAFGRMVSTSALRQGLHRFITDRAGPKASNA
jgi:enoyl-CoA hydratase/carnithine racemase